MMTRADRNNNPGNLRPGKMMFTGQTGVDGGGFAVFGSPDAGMAAADQNLAHYGSIGVNTPTSIANRWTTTDRPQRIAAIQAATGAGPNDQIDLTDPAVRSKVLNQATYPLEGATMHDAIGDLIDSAIKRQPSADPHGDAIDAAIRRPGTAANAGVDSGFQSGFRAIIQAKPAPGAPDTRFADATAFAKDHNQPVLNPDELKSAIANNDGMAVNGAPTPAVAPEGQTAFDRAAATDGPMGTPAAEQAAAKPPIDTVTGHTVSGDMQAGAAQGARDTFGGLNEAASWADRNFAPLNMLDQAASNLLPGIAPNKIQQAVNQYNQQRDDYNAHYDSQYSGLGRLIGTVATQAPLLAAGGGMLAAGADAGLGSEVANPMIQFLAGRGGSTVGQRVLSLGASGAATGAASGALGSAANPGSVGQQALTGALTGAVASPVLGKITGGYQGVGASLDPATAQLAQRAADMGINIRGSQLSTSPFVRTVDSVLSRVPGSGIAADNAAQRAAGTSAIAGTFGARDLTPAGMSDAKQALSNNYNQVADRTNLNLTPESGSPFVDNLAAIRNDAQGAVGTDKLPAVDRLLDNVMSKVGPDGTMPGASFKALTSKGAMLDKAIGSGDPGLSGVAKGIKGELNSALERSAAPEDVALLRHTDMQWKNMRTVEKLAAKSPNGQVSLQSLNQPVSSSFGNRAYTGAGQLGDLADLGQIIKDPGSSNTAERSQLYNMLTGAAKFGGGGLLATAGIQHGMSISPMEAMAGMSTAGGGAILGRVLGGALKNPGYRNKLIEAALNGNTPGPINYIPQALGAIGGNQINRLAGAQAAQGTR